MTIVARSTTQLFDLSGKTALITGGSRGLGLQMAEALGEQGASIVISARKNLDAEALRIAPNSGATFVIEGTTKGQHEHQVII